MRICESTTESIVRSPWRIIVGIARKLIKVDSNDVTSRLFHSRGAILFIFRRHRHTIPRPLPMNMVVQGKLPKMEGTRPFEKKESQRDAAISSSSAG